MLIDAIYLPVRRAKIVRCRKDFQPNAMSADDAEQRVVRHHDTSVAKWLREEK